MKESAVVVVVVAVMQTTEEMVAMELYVVIAVFVVPNTVGRNQNLIAPQQIWSDCGTLRSEERCDGDSLRLTS